MPQGDLRLLQYCNYSLILSIVIKIGSLLKKDDTSEPCFESIWVKIKCYSISQLHILNYYLIVVRQYFAIVIILADQNHVI